MYSLDRTHRAGPPLFVNFYTRRLFRIYPASLLTVVAALALHLDSDIHGIRGLSHAPFPGLLTAISNLLLIQNLTYSHSIVNVLWSLPFELQMYAVLPFLFIWIRGRQVLWPMLGLWIISALLGAAQPHIPALGRLSLLAFLPNFIPGVIAYARPHAPRIRSWFWPPFILLLVAIFTLRPGTTTGWALCLCLGLLLPSFAEIATPWLRSAANLVATYSYGIYLSHQFCIWFAFGVLASYPLVVKILVLLASLFALPVLLYHGVEKPMLQSGSRLAARLTPLRVT
jgi:peptidoglycan/LPS O-acetylase OafA/YrhL